MFYHYLLFFLRFIKRTKPYFFINIFGLAFSAACVILLFNYIAFHFSFDKFHSNIDRMVRVTLDTKFGSEELKEATTMPPLAHALEQEFPEVEKTVRIFDPNLFDKAIIVTREELSFKENDILYVDSSFFSLFSFRLKEGSARTCLSKPNSVVITEKTKRKYFGDQPALGETLTFNKDSYVVTGIAENPPSNSHFTFDLLASFSERIGPRADVWVNAPYYTYAILRHPNDKEKLQAKLGDFARRHISADLEKYFNTTYDNLLKAGGKFDFVLQSVTDIHLHSKLGSEIAVNEDYDRIKILTGVAIFIVIIACINFINLTTALSGQRAKEIGVKKMFGGARSQLTTQFLTESILYAIIAGLIGLAFALALYPAFNDVMNQQIELTEFLTWQRITGYVSFMIILGIISGIYPALFMSNIKPAGILKGNLGQGLSYTGLRNLLVVVQFAISIFLIACSIMFHRQLRFMASSDLGYNKDQIIVLKNISKLENNLFALKNELSQIPEIKSSSASREIPSAEYQTMLSQPEGSDQARTFAYFLTDEDYLKTFGLKVVEGRNFNPKFSDDSLGAVLINQSLAKELQLEEVIGRSIDARAKREIVGVIKDFNFEGLRHQIQPLAIYYSKNTRFMDFLSVRYDAANTDEVLQKIEQRWKKVAGSLPFEYEFLDQRLADQYRSEQNFHKITTAFTILSVFVSSLGLIGLITFAIKKREREISIRKVLGSTVAGIQFIFAKDILRLLFVSSVVAIPPSIWFILDWLEGFSYRTKLDPFVFIIAMMSMCLITFSAILYFTLKAAFVNPIHSLRRD